MLTGFQLRAARSGLNIYVKDLSQNLGLHHTTILRLEEVTQNLAHLKCNLRTLLLIKNYFEKHDIVFPGENTISLNKKNVFYASKGANTEITKFQFKAARIAMRLTQQELGFRFGLAQSSLSEIEGIGQNTDFISCHPNNKRTIIKFFESKGIVFPNYETIHLTEDPVLLLNN